MTAEQVIDALGLEYLDGEGCWIRLLWRTEHANAIYALLTPNDFSATTPCRRRSLDVRGGAAAEIVVLHNDGTHDVATLVANCPPGRWRITAYPRTPGKARFPSGSGHW